MDIELVMRYMFAFVLKNPAGFRDDFWITFLGMFTLIFWCLDEMVYVFLSNPPKDMFLQVCIDQKLPQQHSVSGKFSYTLPIMSYTISINFFFFYRISHK